MQNFITGRQHQFMHITNQPVNVALANFLLCIIPNEHPAMLQGFDVLAGDADVNYIEIHATGVAGLFAGANYGFDRFFDVIHDAAHDAFGLDFTGPENV